MTYLQARTCLAAGGCLYRPHWKTGEYIQLGEYAGKFLIVKCVKNHPRSIWIASAEDLSADDWEQETFAVLAE